MGLPRLAELGGQLMQVEGGRVMGRVIMGEDPIPNRGFGLVLDHFTDVPAAVTAAGFPESGGRATTFSRGISVLQRSNQHIARGNLSPSINLSCRAGVTRPQPKPDSTLHAEWRS
jgi:hypothetical protein